jgi:DNA repair exonuclease SbcCD ATPase subunit
MDPPVQTDADEVQQQVSALKKKLEDAAIEVGHLQRSITSQQQLEQLLRQGRVHLQDLRHRLQEATQDRDRLVAELNARKTAHERELQMLEEELGRSDEQLQKMTAERDRLVREAEERQTAHKQEVEAFDQQLGDSRSQHQKMTADRDRLGRELQEFETVHRKHAEERAKERSNFERLVAEAKATEKTMSEEIDGQRQQIESLREAAARAQSLAKEILRAHESK